MEWTTIGAINEYKGGNVNPSKHQDEYFELYSVPSFDDDYPEIVQGSEIASSKQIVETGDVLLCKINPRINRVWQVGRHTDNLLIASSEWIVVRSKNYIPKYLRYYFSSKNFRDMMNLQVAGIGGSLTRVQPKQVATYKVPVISLAEQGEIVARLDGVEALLANRRAALAALDTLVKSRFQSQFGDPVLNEYEFPVEKLGNIAEIKIGPFGSLLHKEDYVVGQHALVNPSHIIDGQIVIDEKLTVTDEKYEELKAYQLLIGDIVLGRRGEMGRAAVVDKEGLLCGTGSLVIRSRDIIKPYFLQKILSYPTYKRYIDEQAVGVTMQNLNVAMVSNFAIPIYPQELQNKYIAFVAEVERLRAQLTATIASLTTLRAACMQHYFH